MALINNLPGSKGNRMHEKKQNIFKSPDLSLLQEVVIDYRTTIYIAPGADPEEARSRYLSRINSKHRRGIY